MGVDGCQRPTRRRHTLPINGDNLGFSLEETWKKVESSVEAVRGPFHARKRAYTMDVTGEMAKLASDSSGIVQVKNLGDLGFTTEDLSRVLYDKFRAEQMEDMPDFLENIYLEKKGGLHRIGDIWHWHKYFWFATMMCTAIFNMSYLMNMDGAMVQYTARVLWSAQSLDFLTISDTMRSVTAERSVQTAEMMESLEHQHHPKTRVLLLITAFFVAVCEIMWIFNAVRYSLVAWITFSRDTSEYRAFHCIVDFFKRVLPEFGNFSAIKLMATVHPSLVYRDYLQFVNTSTYRATQLGLTVVSVYFWLSRICYALAAFSAFSIKLLAVGLKLISPGHLLIYRLGNALALMNQCMGCVHLEAVLQERLFLFVFGGQDAFYQDNEHAYKNVYESRVAKQIWQQFWCENKRFKAIVLLATFDHYDLQRLLIEDNGGFEVRVQRTASIIQSVSGTRGDWAVPPRSPLYQVSSVSYTQLPLAALPEASSPRRLGLARGLPRQDTGGFANSLQSGGLSLCEFEAEAENEQECDQEYSETSQSTASVGMGAVTRALCREENPVTWSDAV